MAWATELVETLGESAAASSLGVRRLESGRDVVGIEAVFGSAWLRGVVSGEEVEARLIAIPSIRSIHFEAQPAETAPAPDDVKRTAQLRFVLSAEHVEYVDCRNQTAESVDVVCAVIARWIATHKDQSPLA